MRIKPDHTHLLRADPGERTERGVTCTSEHDWQASSISFSTDTASQIAIDIGNGL